MHYGIHGKKAAELIASRVDSDRPNLGITCVSEKKLKKSDIFIAKNYLTEPELSEFFREINELLWCPGRDSNPHAGEGKGF